MTTDATGADRRLSHSVTFRMRAAVSGLALTAGLLVTTAPTWVSFADRSDVHWNLWSLAAGSPSGIIPPVDGTQAWGRTMVAVLLLLAVLSLVAAAEASFGWAVASAVTGLVSFGLEIGFHFGARDNLVGNMYLYAANGPGSVAVMWMTGLLVVWGAALAYADRFYVPAVH